MGGPLLPAALGGGPDANRRVTTCAVGCGRSALCWPRFPGSTRENCEMDQGSDSICDLVPWSGTGTQVWHPGPVPTVVPEPPPFGRAAAANVNPSTRLSHVTEIPPLLRS